MIFDPIYTKVLLLPVQIIFVENENNEQKPFYHIFAVSLNLPYHSKIIAKQDK